MIQTASDFLVYLGWLFENTGILIGKIFLPVQYIYTFLKNFGTSALSNPVIPDEIWTFDNEILGVFAGIPYWNTIIFVLVLGLSILFAVFILKTFLRS
jgi:hypothetical protein